MIYSSFILKHFFTLITSNYYYLISRLVIITVIIKANAELNHAVLSHNNHIPTNSYLVFLIITPQ